jgi:hypothetical protein
MVLDGGDADEHGKALVSITQQPDDRRSVRIAWIVLTFFGGSGILIYFILWLVVPEAS